MFLYIFSSAYSQISEEKTLCKSLLANYTSLGLNGRPVVNISKSMTVEFGLGLIQMDLDEKNKILSTSMWARYVSASQFGFKVIRKY